MSQTYTHVQRVRVLYKLILRLHRGLPDELQVIGTNYARDEFKRHKKCAPQEAVIFMNEWTNYAISLAKQLGMKGDTANIGSGLSSDFLESLSDEQVVQLYELMKASTAPPSETCDK
ncbi:succinate dehydrogenase assembly factor 3 [Rhynchophorus ferrugineus]|uniref:Succinate dehydrogenase assembly factor 3 n=1 Tax=Rhynchophorus ferrugineus TaxID=354439 RepID=A0A834IH46_RHYFE|nr:hypothetical protein GWI33_009152 [Rhynchophorus ferrugineus]